MFLMTDVTADQSPLPGHLALQNVTSKEIACLSEELVAYQQHFAPLFYRREQREWAALYLRGLLTADAPDLDSHFFLPFGIAQVRLLLQVALPQSVLDLPAVLTLVAYQQLHNYAAYYSYRKRLLAQLQGLHW